MQGTLLLHVLLQTGQRGEPGLDLRHRGGFLLHQLLGLAAAGIDLRQLGIEGGQLLLGMIDTLPGIGQVARQLLEPRRIGALQVAFFLLQALAALRQGLQLAVGFALFLRGQGQVLLDLRQRASQLGQAGSGVAYLGLDVGQPGLRLFGDNARLLGAGLAHGQVFLGLGQLVAAGLVLLVPLRDLLLQLRQLNLHAVARLDHVLDLGLEPADLGIRLVEPSWAA